MSRALLLLLLPGCLLPDLSGALDPGRARSDEPVLIGDTADPLFVVELTVDATDAERWVGFDLDALELPVDPEGATWDLRFRRYEVELDGGVSGDGDVAVAWVDASFDGLTEVPDGIAWLTDGPDADGDGVPERALDGWYVYDQATHQLSPAPGAWLVRTNAGALFRLAFLSYYDPAGTPARLRLQVGPLDPAHFSHDTGED